MDDLTGRVALVTGGSRGIGAAVALRLARDGADVAITYRSAADQAALVVKEIEQLGRRALAVQADSADAAAVGSAVDAAVTELGRLDVLVNNAGVFPYGPFEEVTLDELDRTLAIHARAAFVAAQAASPHLGSDGRIISIGSNLAERVPFPGIALYAMSKSALLGLTRALARELGPRGITVNLVQPGSTDTDMNPADGDSAEHQRSLTALGRYQTADEVAATVAHLAGPGGRTITGASLLVDAGTNA
ncbi:NAD(P)-dependent dehydrogenase (short-subunit alcohol dehydrogenase family) [Pseudonocardia hierapolitana]|uniref:NAD(P)-dependent dehydrogenase (Short-subunit alcohol dehydrogenase family) n=1 Tax=Pseudonocardia hierapolitana TaxID=1128676 RepID=A0A561SVC6_9PSEU|nr:SDR family oxidoreductase [Pseudonocardia hierapolitana]TWF78796.1 NAD(P)-dependent dehydrogenase (short-subunit alcohol dehydrogenase family) [Pseudonocardia hierapolitana]